MYKKPCANPTYPSQTATPIKNEESLCAQAPAAENVLDIQKHRRHKQAHEPGKLNQQISKIDRLINELWPE